MELFLLLSDLQSKNLFYKKFLAFKNESKTGFENRKWNSPNRKWNHQLAWPQLETQLGQNSAWAKATPAFIFMCVCLTRQAYLFLKSYIDPFNQKTSFTKCI